MLTQEESPPGCATVRTWSHERPCVDAEPGHDRWTHVLWSQERGDVDEEESWVSPSGEGGR